MRAGIIATTVAAIAISTGSTYAAEPAQPPETGGTKVEGKLMLVLDSSGSMKEQSPGGGAKIDVAKNALKNVVKSLPDEAQVGMRVFGAEVFSRDDEGACTDTQNVVPVGPIDRDKLADEVDSYKPYGETPIGNALKGAAEDLGSEGKRTIVLLSDGEPTCDPDPCEVAKDLRGEGIDLTINVVGLNVGGAARDALSCIAREGGGTYYDVDKPEELTNSLVTISVRSLREFAVTGKAVDGSEQIGAATPIKTGQYTSSIDAEGTDDYFVVKKPKSGSVAVSVTSRPEVNEDFTQSMNIELLTPDGATCTRTNDRRFNVLQTRSVLSSGAYFAPNDERATDACKSATEFIVRVFYEGSGEDIDYEMVAQTYPEVTNLADLPAAIDKADFASFYKTASADGDSTPVVGGASFNDAPALEPGAYSDTLRSGEQLIYRVPVGWGQAPRVSIRTENDANAAALLSVTGVNVEVTGFNPLRQPLENSFNVETNVNSAGRYTGDDPETLTAAYLPVQVRNIEPIATTVNNHAMAGDYYFSIEMGRESSGAENFAAPLAIAVELDGEVSGEPAYAEDFEKAEKDTAAADDASGPPWPLIAGLGLLAPLLVGATLLWLRRRTARDLEPTGAQP